MLTPEESKIFQDMILEMKEQFVADIARGRAMNPKAVRKLADGRIFSGNEAKKLGLVDEIGNLEDSIELAAQMAGMPEKPKVVYPQAAKPSFVDYLLSQSLQWLSRALLEGDGRGPAALESISMAPLFFYALP
jgi:protease-4